jgi:glucose-6-phosphate 1-dehydrogenase
LQLVLDDMTPLYEYAPNTWGPVEANQLIASDGGWLDPQPMTTAP